MHTTGSTRLAVFLLLALLAGCYHVALTPPAPVAPEAPLLPAHIEIPPATAQATYTLRSGLAGIANRWTIQIGRAVVDYAHAYLPNAFPPGGPATVTVDLTYFEVYNFAAHADLHFMVAAPDGVLFERTYTCVGQGHAGAVVAAGAFAMKAAMRETTDEALRSCFAQFLADARPLAPSWATALRTAHRGA
jgi:hypothetical protein